MDSEAERELREKLAKIMHEEDSKAVQDVSWEEISEARKGLYRQFADALMPLIQRHVGLKEAAAFEAAAQKLEREGQAWSNRNNKEKAELFRALAREVSELTPAAALEWQAEHDAELLTKRDMEWWEQLALNDAVAPTPETVKKWVLDVQGLHDAEVAAAARREERERIAAKHRPVVRSEDIICECGAFLISRLVQREPHELQYKWTEHIRALATPERSEGETRRPQNEGG